jgi:hypothetical protein
LLKERRLSLPDDAALRDELLNTHLRETSPGTYRIDHAAGRHDDRAISLALDVEALAKGDGGQGLAFLAYMKRRIGAVSASGASA